MRNTYLKCFIKIRTMLLTIKFYSIFFFNNDAVIVIVFTFCLSFQYLWVVTYQNTTSCHFTYLRSLTHFASILFTKLPKLKGESLTEVYQPELLHEISNMLVWKFYIWYQIRIWCNAGSWSTKVYGHLIKLYEISNIVAWKFYFDIKCVDVIIWQCWGKIIVTVVLFLESPLVGCTTSFMVSVTPDLPVWLHIWLLTVTHIVDKLCISCLMLYCGL